MGLPGGYGIRHGKEAVTNQFETEWLRRKIQELGAAITNLMTALLGYVPYIGATKDVDLGNFAVTAKGNAGHLVAVTGIGQGAGNGGHFTGGATGAPLHLVERTRVAAAAPAYGDITFDGGHFYVCLAAGVWTVVV